MRNFWIQLTCIVALPLTGWSQNITLESCLNQAVATNPLYRMQERLPVIEEAQAKQVTAMWLPSLKLGGQATWQSQVTSVPIEFPGINIPTPTKDQYRVTADVQQTIWDGGMIQAQEQLLKAQTAVQQQSLETQLYAIKEQVIQTYFNIRLAQDQLNLLQTQQQSIQGRLKQIHDLVNAQITSISDERQLEMKAEELALNILDARAQKQVALDALETLTGQPYDTTAVFEDYTMATADETQHPMIALYARQTEATKAQETIILRQNRPQIGAFATAGYGRPGLNMLSNEFDTYAIVGARLTWDLSKFYNGTQKHALAVQRLQREQIQDQQDAWQKGQDVQMQREENALASAERSRDSWDRRLALAQANRKDYEGRYDAGLVAYSELLDRITEEQTAEQMVTQARVRAQWQEARIAWLKGEL